MKAVIIKNSLIVGALLLLIIPYNFIYQHYNNLLMIQSFIVGMVYALLCGAALILMDLSNRLVNMAFALFFLLFCLVNIYFYTFFADGNALVLYYLMFGALLTATLKKNGTPQKEGECKNDQ